MMVACTGRKEVRRLGCGEVYTKQGSCSRCEFGSCIAVAGQFLLPLSF